MGGGAVEGQSILAIARWGGGEGGEEFGQVLAVRVEEVCREDTVGYDGSRDLGLGFARLFDRPSM